MNNAESNKSNFISYMKNILSKDTLCYKVLPLLLLRPHQTSFLHTLVAENKGRISFMPQNQRKD